MNPLHVHTFGTPYITCIYENITELFTCNVPLLRVTFLYVTYPHTLFSWNGFTINFPVTV